MSRPTGRNGVVVGARFSATERIGAYRREGCGAAACHAGHYAAAYVTDPREAVQERRR